MEGFFDDLEKAVRAENWHAALVMSLTLPDICAKAVTPTEGSKRRYVAWFDQHLRPRYTSGVGPWREPVVFLSGDDCYALRCALLHEGSADITQQQARKVLELFRFYVPGKRNIRAHRNRMNDTLILMVDEFATEVLDAARAWWRSLPEEERAATRQRQLVLSDSDTMLGI